MVLDNLRMPVVPIDGDDPPEWWWEDGFFTNATIVDTDSPSLSDQSAPCPATNFFTLHLSIQLRKEDGDLDTPADSSSPLPHQADGAGLSLFSLAV